MLAGKVAIVTGASRGIGASIAIKLAENGARVVLNGTNEDLLNDLSRRIGDLGETSAVVPGDVSDVGTAEMAVALARETFGRIDILVNNAGINTRSGTLEMSIEDWNRVLDVNLNGTLHFCRAVLPVMIAQKGGKIVNVSSTAAKTPHKNAAPAYGASKAAVNYLTQHLAHEMGKHCIFVNAVCPGPIETDMTDQWSEMYRASVIQGVPLGRMGAPTEISDVVLFLASDMSNFVNGETINANGGTYMN